jgi:hypothetical protein
MSSIKKLSGKLEGKSGMVRKKRAPKIVTQDPELELLVAKLDALKTRNRQEDEEEEQEKEDEVVGELAAFLSLARQQVTAWGLSGRAAPDFDQLYGTDQHEPTTLTLCFDLDVATDALSVSCIEVSAKEDGERKEFHFAWDEHGEAEPRSAAIAYGVETNLSDYRLAAAASEKAEYHIPDFAKMLSDRRGAFHRLVAEAFVVDEESHEPQVENTRALRRAHSATDRLLLNLWLGGHDPKYLVTVYGLAAPATRVLPQLLSEDGLLDALLLGESSIRYFLRDDAPEPKSEFTIARTTRLREISVSGNNELTAPDLFVTVLYESEGTRSRTPTRDALALYLKLTKLGFLFFEDVSDGYEKRGDALAALFRLKRQVLGLPVRAEVRRVAAGRESVARPAYAELLPRSERFAAPAAPASYTRGEAEERWRAICASGSEAAEDLDELRRVAEGLEISTKAATAVGLCKAIARQLEAEFGERARLREQAARTGPRLAANGETPTSEQIAALLASGQPRRRQSPPRK